MESTTLHVASKKDCADLKCFLGDYLPGACDVYQVVLSVLISPSDAIKFYFTRGSDGTFSAIVSLTIEHCLDQDSRVRRICTSSTWAEDEKDLLEIYRLISEIDWKDDGIILFWSGDEYQPMYPTLLSERQVDNEFIEIETYVMEMQTAFALQLELPDGIYVKSLERVHAPIVYQHWPFSPSTQVEYMADELDRHPSAGLFLKKNDQLVSWAMAHPPMGISRLFTLPAHRRKGYASLVIVYISKRMAQCGYIPFGNIRIDNTSSVTFFESLGFQKVRRRYMINKRPHNCFNVKIQRAKGNR